MSNVLIHPKYGSYELLLLRDPTYVEQLLAIGDPTPEEDAAQSELTRLIEIFNTKPLLKKCHKCGQQATQGSVYKRTTRYFWWCDTCNPCSAMAERSKLVMVRAYHDTCGGASHHASPEYALPLLVMELAQAKGLPARVGEAQAKAFFKA